MTKRAPRATFSNSIAGRDPGGQGREGRSRSALLVGTALGASILIFTLAPNHAWAANDCGAPVVVGSTDIVVCSPAGNTYPSGITYTDSSGNALSLILEPGVSVFNDNFNEVFAHSTGNAVIVAYAGDQILGPHKALYAYSQGGPLALVETDANVTGYYGVIARATTGAAEIFNGGPVIAYAVDLLVNAPNGYGRVQNSGNLKLSGYYGVSGYGIEVEAHTGVVTNTGAINASGSWNEVTGAAISGANGYLQNSGAITVSNTEGLATGLSVSGEGGGPAVVRNTGDLSVYGYSHAKGIYAYGVTASVSSTGNISTTSADGSAIAARVNSFGGYANLVLDGTIYAHALGGSYAYGAKVTGSGPGVFDLTGGSIYAKSDHGSATGVGEYMTGNAAYVNTRAGSVTAYGLITAIGVSGTGDSVTIHSGEVSAYSGESTATGINAVAATGEVTVRGYGDVTATGGFGATGVLADANSGYASVVIDGNITVGFGQNAGTGLSVSGYTGGYVRVDGNVSVDTLRGANGIELQTANGNATVYVAGNVYVDDVYGGVAMGVKADAESGNALVEVTGNVNVRGQSRSIAYGVDAVGYNATVVVGGYVNVVGDNSTIGVEALAPGNSTVIVEGTVGAFAYDGEAIGVTASSGAGHTTDVSVGGIFAHGVTAAYGITTGDNGQSQIYVGSGGVTVYASGKAVGVAGVSGESSSSVTVVGDTNVTSVLGSAVGLESSSPLSSSLNSEGNVTVSGYSYALGLKDSSGQNAEVQEFGNVTVTASNGPAKGVLSVGSIYADVNLNGAVNVTSSSNNAYGVIIDGFGGTTGEINGNVTVHGFSYGIGVLAESGSGTVTLDINGGVNVSARYNAMGVKGVSYAESSTLTVNGPVTVTSTAGSATGVENSSSTSNSLTIDGNVSVTGATYALGLKDSSGQNAYLNESGNLTVTATGANAVAQGVISVGSQYANASLSGVITVTSQHGAAYGVTLSGYEGVNGNLSGSVAVTAHDYALGVLAESGDGNVNLTGGGDVSATSLYTNATAVRAISPFTTAMALGNVTASGFYNATGVYATGTTVNVGLQSVDARSTFGVATGVYVDANASEINSATVDIAGNVTAVSTHENAAGVIAYAYAGPVDVTVGGTTNVVSKYKYAVGVRAIAHGYYPGTVTVITGDVHASGYAGAVGVYASALGSYVSNNLVRPNALKQHDLYGYGGNTVTVTTGNVSATSVFGQAIGVYATGANSAVHVAGTVNVSSSYGNVYGVESFTTQTGNVTVDGDVRAVTGGYGTAIGIFAEGYGDQSITAHGNIVAASGEQAWGAYANSGGNASIHIDGNVYSHAGLNTYGVAARTFYGSSTVYVGGDVIAHAGPNTENFSYAYGVYVNAGGDSDVHVGGNVIAYNPAGAAIGVKVKSEGNATIYVGGAIDASATEYQDATGVYASAGNVSIHAGSVQAVGYVHAYGIKAYADYATVDVSGNVTAIAGGNYALGIRVEAYAANVTVGGNVYARSFTDNATGIETYNFTKTGTSSVTADGDVTAIGITGATGISANASDGVTVHVGGNVYARAYGAVTGVIATSSTNTASVYVGGNLTAKSKLYGATGVSAYGYSVDVTVKGDARAFSPYKYAIGVYARTSNFAPGELSVIIGGNITAVGGEVAKGLDTSSDDYNYIKVTGQVSAYAHNGDAYAIETSGTGNFNFGGLSAVAHGGFAYGADMVGEDGAITLHVTDSVYARAYGGNATGLFIDPVAFYGNIGGDVTAISDETAKGVFVVTTYGPAELTVNGNVTAISYGSTATGAYMTSPGYAYLHVLGNVIVQADGAAVGIDLVSDNIVYANVGGEVHVTSQTSTATGVDLEGSNNSARLGSVFVAAYGNAVGVTAPGGELSNIRVLGDVTVVSSDGAATGVNSTGSIFAFTSVYGNVHVTGYGTAVGVKSNSDGEDNVFIVGNVSAVSTSGSAYGVNAHADSGGAYVTVYGGVYAHGYSKAVGIEGTSSSNLHIYAGSATAISVDGNATGIYASAENGVVVEVTDEVYAKSPGAAFGVDALAFGVDYVTVGGDVTAISTSSTATGVNVHTFGVGSATVGGSVFAQGYGNATGVNVYGQGGATANITGGVEAISDIGSATGVYAYSEFGNATITVGGNVATFAHGEAIGVSGVAGDNHLTIDVGGNVYATSYFGNAVGIHAYSADLDKITVGGDVRVYALNNATGVDVSGDGPVKANITGVVSGVATDGEAIGLYAHNGSYAAIYLGAASAHGAADAFGVYANVPGAVYLTVTGDVNAVSTGANAEGVSIRTPSVVTVDIGGQVTAVAPGSAKGVYVAGGSTVSATIGSVYARSTGEAAYGVEILASGDVNANVTHNVTVLAYGNAVGISGNSSGGNVTLGDGGNITAIVSGEDGYAYGIRALAPAGYAAIHGGANTYVYSHDGASGLFANASAGVFIGATGNVRAVGHYFAAGVEGYSAAGNVTVDLGGTASAISTYYALGIEARSVSGNVNVTAAGAVAVADRYADGSRAIAINATSKYGAVSVTTAGDVYASAGHYVRGVNANAYGDTTIAIGGNVTALGYYSGATGIYSISEHGNASASVGGDVYVGSKYGAHSYGVVLRATGNVTANVTGGIDVRSGQGDAFGVSARGEYDRVYTGGDVTAISGQGGATGVAAKASEASYVTVKGNVYVSGVGYAAGVSTSGGQTYTCEAVYGNVTARATVGDAYGLTTANGVESGVFYVGGNVLVVAQYNATGVKAFTYDDASVNVLGDVGAYAHAGTAIGVVVNAPISGSVYIGGNATAVSDLGSATAMGVDVARNTGSASVIGNVYARGATSATGVIVSSNGYGGDVYVGGNVTALAGSGPAIGVEVFSGHGYKYSHSVIDVGVVGSATAISTSGAATGVLVHDYYASLENGYTQVFVGGDVKAQGALDAYGVNAETGDVVKISVTGNVLAVSTTANAYGVSVTDGYSSDVRVGGDVAAYGSVNATGVHDYSYAHASTYVGGNVVAKAYNGSATGVTVTTGPGGDDSHQASIHVVGSIYAGAPGSAMGAYARAGGAYLAPGYSDIEVDGSITAKSTGGNATGADARGYTTATIEIGGNVAAIAYNNAIGVYADGGSATANVTGDVTAISTDAAAVGVNVLADYYGNVHVGGNVYAKAPNSAYGVTDNAGVANVSVDGNVIAISTGAGGAVTGVSVDTNNDAFINVGGDVYAAGNAAVHGIYSFSAYGQTTITVGGNVTAKSTNGNVSGVNATAGKAGISDTDISVTIGGATHVSSYAGAAYGVYVNTLGNATVKTGDVTAYSHSSNATGIQVHGDSYIGVTGNATAVSILGNARAVYGNSSGYLGIHVTGNVYAYSQADRATGVYAISAGDSVIDLDGNVEAITKTQDAVGLSVDTGGNSTVAIGGNVIVKSTSGYVYGVYDAATHDGNITVTGEITAISITGRAIGLEARGDVVTATIGGAYVYSQTEAATGEEVSGNTATAATTGDVFVKSVDSNALGVYAGGGYANVHAVGNVTAISTSGNAVGVSAVGLTSAYAYVSGQASAKSVEGTATAAYAFSYDHAKVQVGTAYAYSKTGAATGVKAFSFDYASVGSTGDVFAKSYAERAVGAYAYSKSGDSYAHIGGNATGVSHDGKAYGVDVFADNGYAAVSVAGAAAAYSKTNSAFGVSVDELTGAYVHVGSAYANGNQVAMGVVVTGGGYGTVVVDGDAFAKSANNEAIGVDVNVSGNASVTIGGNATARAPLGSAYGVFAEGGNVAVTVTGMAIATSITNGATGVHATSQGYVSVSVGGAYAYAVDGAAYGVYARGRSVQINSTGNVFAQSIDSTAIGLRADAYNSAFIHVVGNLTAKSTDADAFGAWAAAPAYAEIYVSGAAVAISTDGNATGAYAAGGLGLGQVVVGSAYAYSEDLRAIGIDAYGAGIATATATGDVRARSTGGEYHGSEAWGAYARSGLYASVTIGGNAVALATYSNAIGVKVSGGLSADAYVTGAAIAYSTKSYAMGVSAQSRYGDVTVEVGSAYANGVGSAFGVHAVAADNISITSTGDVFAKVTPGGKAVGAYAKAGDYAYVNIGGNAIALSPNNNAYGVQVIADSANVTVGGEVEAITNKGEAYGVQVTTTGAASVSVGGGYVYSHYFARGVEVTAGGDIYGGVSKGTLYVKTTNDINTDTIGVDLYSAGGNITLGGAGNIVVVSDKDQAIGAYVDAHTGNAGGSIGGDVTAIGAEAFGMDIHAKGNASAGVGGNVVAYGTYGATGAAAYAGETASVTIGGNVTAISTAPNTLVRGAVAFGAGHGAGEVSIDGSVYVRGGTSFGVVADGADATSVSIGGNTVVKGTYQAHGVYSRTFYGGEVSITTGNVSAIASDGYAVAIAGNARGTAAAPYSENDVNGNIVVDVNGSVLAYGTTFAAGVALFGTNGLSANVTGNLSVYGGNASSYQRSYGPAYSAAGVVFRGGQDDSATVGGTLLVQASGSVIGVDAYSVNGSYYAFAGEHTNVSVGLGGLKAVTTGANTSAIGALVDVGGNISVDVTGNTVVMGGDYARGIAAISYDGGNISVHLGNVIVGESGNATTDSAMGVFAETTGNIGVDITGYTLVGGELATGVYSYSTGSGNITIDVGNVTVHQYAGYATDNSAGILAYTQGNVSITAGDIITTGNYIVGIRLSGHNFTPTGNITLNVGNVTTMGDHSPGFYLVTDGNANITVGNIYTAGNYSDGVYLKSVDGNASVTAGNVTTKGNHSDGLYVWAYDNASVTATGTVYTKGAHSDGVFAYSETGNVSVTANTVVTKGDYSQGIHAVAGGVVTVNNTFNDTYGAHSDAVYAKNSGTTPLDTVTVTSGTAITHGNYSYAIFARGFHADSVTSAVAETFGNHSTAIYAGSVNGPVTVNSGTVYTVGKYSQGIYVVSGGTASVTANMTETKGDDSAGINVAAPGSIYVDSHYVRTYGFSSTAIGVSSTNGPVDVVSYAVHTSGEFAEGIVADAVYGNVGVTSTQVITDGEYATGINAGALHGNTVVASGYVRTNGDHADGILATTATGAVNATSGGVVTYGDYAYGVIASTNFGDVTVTSTYVGTHGYDSAGIIAHAAVGDVSITSGTVKTFGDVASGVTGSTYTGNVAISATYTATHGYHADGVDGISRYGNVAIHVGVAKTYGGDAYGSYGFSDTGNVYIGVTGGVITHGNLSTGVSAYAASGNASINAVYARTYGAHAVGLYAKGGASASVTANTVRTSGDYSIGVLAVSGGNASSNSYYVHTSGLRSDGVYVDGATGASATNTGYVATTGNYSAGIVAHSSAGAADVTSKTVITFGYQADGIVAYGLTGATVDNTHVVKTTGYGSRGIMATSDTGPLSVTSDMVLTYGDEATGIFAFGNHSGASVTSTMVYTAGAYAGGIDAESKYGNVSVTSTEVITKGDHSTGIYTYAIYAGTTEIHSTDVRTYGNHSAGIWGVGYSGLKIYSGQVVTHGNYSTGIEAVNYIGDVLVSTTGVTAIYGADSDAIFAQNFKSGNVSVTAGATVYARDGVGVHIDAEGGSAYLSNHNRIYGGRGGVVAYSATGTTVENYGAIAGGNGYAMGISGGAALVQNHGSIYGYANFTANNDTVNNAGRWFAYGNTDFGAGTDTFNNTNTVEIAPFSPSATTVNWTGLEVFNNSGLVDLRNGHTGDVFNLGNATWNGTGASTLAVDASLSSSLTSDKLVIGAASGSTVLAVNDVSPGLAGMINLTGTTVVQGTSGVASDFTWVGRRKGFIDYELKFFSSSVSWNIVALPDNAAFEMLKAPAMAQSFWERTGDTWSDREQEVRDSMLGSTPPTRGEGWELWANAQGGNERLGRNQQFNVNGGAFNENLSTDSTWGGFQMGGDNWTSKNWLWGFTGGFVDQNSSFRLDHNSFDITGWNAGLYGGFTSGAFFANALVKGDLYDVRANMHTAAAMDTFHGSTWGAKGEAGFRLGGPALYFEPRADISWTSTHLNNANFPTEGTTFTVGDATSAKGSIGGRIGGQVGSILPYVGIYAVQEFDGKNGMTMITGSGCPSCMSVEDLRPGSYERAEFGFTTTSWNGLEGFAKGEAEFGSHTDGFSGTLGVRWRW